MKTNFELVREFHEKFSLVPKPTQPSTLNLTEALIRLRVKLLDEEFNELVDEFYSYEDEYCESFKKTDDIDQTKVAKELADLLYVTYGFFDELGINADEVFRRVHESNMSKLDKDGNVLRREDGKILKSDLYQEPTLPLNEIGIDNV